MNAPFSSDPSFPPASIAPERPPAPRQAPSVPISVYRELATELKATQALVDSLTHQNQQLNQQNQVLRQEMLNFTESAAQLRQSVESSHMRFADLTTQLKQSLEIGMPVEVSMPLTQPQGQSIPQGQSMMHAQAQGQPTLDLPMEAMYPQASAPVMLSEPEAEAGGGGLSSLVGQFTQMVKPKPQKAPKAVAKPPAKVPAKRPQPALYTEERLEPSRSSQASDKSADMSGLWLATTIVLIVVSAFGAGFLIMKPLLSNSR